MKRVVIHNPDEDPSTPAQSQPPADAPPTRRPQPRQTQSQSLPPELVDILVPSLKVGGIAGACGLFTGAAVGIIRSAPTVFFSLISGGQWFTLASTYYAARQLGMQHLGNGEPTPGDKLKASTLAGGVAGTCGGLLRGPRNILPGALMFSLFGAGGQAFANWRAKRAASAPPAEGKEGKGFWAKWSPITHLTDQDYEKILEERLLRVEADIAVLDDHVKELRESETQTKEAQTAGAEKRDSAAATSEASKG